MAYSLDYSAEAVIQLEKIDKSIAKRILKKIDMSVSNPHHFFRQLSGRPEYKLRVGDYRIIADINGASKKMFIRTVGHRKNIYYRI
ncbi:MAG: type II toxin-antitoxin system RelE/ParE family toxin [Candidatus Micrarchaeota archaeon]|nr:type II toxin-antitoxin system RelE/ParE family toxin [Candidatus Micrarchaeota archaeon]